MTCWENVQRDDKCVDKGWESLTKPLWDWIEAHPGLVRVVQVKEKFGGLRFYYDFNYTGEEALYAEFSIMVRTAELASYKTCEVCGVSGVPRSGGWIKTLCDTHSRGRPALEK